MEQVPEVRCPFQEATTTDNKHERPEEGLNAGGGEESSAGQPENPEEEANAGGGEESSHGQPENPEEEANAGGGEESSHGQSQNPGEEPNTGDDYDSDKDWPDMELDADELLVGDDIEVKKAALRRAAFAKSRWHNGNALGSGGFGSVFVTYKLDEHQRVRKRAAVKDCFMQRRHVDTWTYWDGDVKDLENRVPIETAIMTALGSKARTGAEKTVLLHTARPFNRVHHTYRLYMEYCNSSLSDAIARRLYLIQNDPTSPAARPFPEFLLWKWLEDLTEACIAMSEGSLDTDTLPENWRPIVHRDIKPANLLITDPFKDCDWPDVPVLRVTDFGASIFTDANDPHNPMSYNYGPSTKGWEPPELTSITHRLGLTARGRGPLSSATNIWQIGTAIIATANLQTHREKDDFKPRVRQDAVDAGFYSQPLVNLLHRCVRQNPALRIPARELLEEIKRNTGEGPEEMYWDRGRGARYMETLPEGMKVRMQWVESKTYRIGLAPPASVDEALLAEQGL